MDVSLVCGEDNAKQVKQVKNSIVEQVMQHIVADVYILPWAIYMGKTLIKDDPPASDMNKVII